MRIAATAALGIVSLIFVVMLIRALSEPMRYLAVILARVLMGYAVLFVINAVAGWWWGYHLPLNPVTAAVTGVLGLPGIVVMVALHQAWV